MRLKDYARNQKKRKDYVQLADLLMVGVDVSETKHRWAPRKELSVVSSNSSIHVKRGVGSKAINCP